VQVRLLSVSNLRHFTWKTQHPFGSISASNQNIFLKIRTQHFPRMGYKWYKFVANRPIIKSTLLEEQSVFSDVVLIPLNGISWKFITAVSKNELQVVQVSFGSFDNEGHLIWRAMCLLSIIYPSIGGIFLSIHSLHSPRMRYKRCKFSCNPSIIKSVSLRV